MFQTTNWRQMALRQSKTSISRWRRISVVCIVSQFILIYFYFFVTSKRPDEGEIILIGLFKLLQST